MSQGIQVVDALHELAVNRGLWNQNTLRTSHELTPHKDVDDIWLRFNDLAPYQGDPAHVDRILDEHESIAYPAWWAMPECRRLAMQVFHAAHGERLGRVLITKIAPGDGIEPHEDGGSHAAYYERAHLVLQGLPGSIFRCGQVQGAHGNIWDEEVQMMTGELWWFNNALTHEVVNNSADDRIHMIIDYKVSRA
jgi:hypothetical protein